MAVLAELNKHIVIAGRVDRLRTRTRLHGAQRFDDSLDGSQDGRDLAHGFRNGIGHEIAGAIDAVEKIGYQCVEAADLAANARDNLSRRGLQIGSLNSQRVSK